jgi:4-oxalocrotonate tautomerase
MPFINIKMTPGPTLEQKAKLISEVTKLVADILGKNPATTHVVIEEVSADNWGIAGETVASRKKRGA